MMFASTSPNQRAPWSPLLLCLVVASGVAGAPPAATKPPPTLTLDLGQGKTLELVRISAGTFQMGSPADEPGRDPDEDAHRVRISRPFHLGRTEVTQQQWQAVMTDDPSTFTGDPLRPVESMTWSQTRAFCRRLSHRVGRTVTLPTEAQWEYACRAGSRTPYALGAELAPRDAHYDWTHDGAISGDRIEETLRVARFSPNAWGLYDMHGNVREWCLDFYARDTYRTAATTDPTGPSTGDNHVLRGGSWYDYARWCRSAYRHGFKPENRPGCNGFRVCVPIASN